MDRTATLTPTSTLETLLVDHAVFTSVRSPMGEGYRIIAASGGLRPDERMETTRRAPSHGSLCETNVDAAGVIGFPLPTGRYCVGYVRLAGKEHTSRGGMRVHTHFVFLTPPQFAAFACDPWLVAGMIAAIDGDEPLLKAESSMPQLSLGEGCVQLPDASPMMPAVEVGWLESIVRSALRGSAFVANSAALSDGCEQLAWRVIPCVMRAKRSISIGIAYSPARNLDVSFVSDGIDEARRAVLGTTALWIDPATPLPETQRSANSACAATTAGPFEDWMALTQKSLNTGRVGELIRLCDAVDRDATPEGLATTARLYEHLDVISFAAEDELARLTTRYSGFAPTCKAQKILVDRFRKAAAHRSAQLAQERDSSLE